MAYYTEDYNYGMMHWACVECLVRPMCDERCNRTYYRHYLCEPCDNGCASFPCKEVEKVQMYELIFRVYGHQMMEAWNKQIGETSIFRLMKLPEKSFDKWWITK